MQPQGHASETIKGVVETIKGVGSRIMQPEGYASGVGAALGSAGEVLTR